MQIIKNNEFLAKLDPNNKSNLNISLHNISGNEFL